MKLGKTVGAALVVAVFLASQSGCEKNEGPMEQAGKSIDKAAEKVGDKVEQAGETIKDAAQGDKK